MLFNGQIRYEQIVLRTESQGVSYGFHVGFDVVTFYQRRARSRTYQSGQHGHCSGFSGTVVTQQNGYLVGMHVDAEFVDDVFAGSETFAERLDLYARFFRHTIGVNFFLEPVGRLQLNV